MSPIQHPARAATTRARRPRGRVDTRRPGDSPTHAQAPRCPGTVWPTTDTNTGTWRPGHLFGRIINEFTSAGADVLITGNGTAEIPAEVMADLQRTHRRVRLDGLALSSGEPEFDLVLALPGQGQHAGEADAERWVSILATGGLLAVLTRAAHRRAQWVDPTGSVVAACRSVGLRYLQHIVTILEPLAPGQLDSPPLPARRVGPRLRRVHADLLIFDRTDPHVPPTRPTTDTGVATSLAVAA